MNQSVSILYDDVQAVDILGNALSQKILRDHSGSEVILVCIGTDRCTGDALGPLVGTMLRKFQLPFPIYGHLDEPVHALNLQDTLAQIESDHPNACILAVDACLGRLQNVGLIQLADGPLKPGAGVKKNLPDVGHLHLTGIVNVGGFMEYLVLQNTRLGIVMQMADVIAASIDQGLRQVLRFRHAESFPHAKPQAHALRTGHHAGGFRMP